MTDNNPMKDEKMVFENVYTGGRGSKAEGRKALAETLFGILREYEKRTGETIDDVEVESNSDGVSAVNVSISSYYQAKGEPNDDK